MAPPPELSSAGKRPDPGGPLLITVTVRLNGPWAMISDHSDRTQAPSDSPGRRARGTEPPARRGIGLVSSTAGPPSEAESLRLRRLAESPAAESGTRPPARATRRRARRSHTGGTVRSGYRDRAGVPPRGRHRVPGVTIGSVGLADSRPSGWQLAGPGRARGPGVLRV
eukprot:132943-Hanusia_phi.AAC.1